MSEERPPERMTPDELERLLEAHPRFRRADPQPEGEVDITFITGLTPGTETRPSRKFRELE